MTKTTELGIFNLLERLAVESGEANVRRACKKFLRKKTVSGVKPTKREDVPESWLMEAWAKQRGICKRCKTKVAFEDAEPDHRMPIAKGGKHRKSNIVALCKPCNRSKGANDPFQESKKTGKTILEQLE